MGKRRRIAVPSACVVGALILGSAHATPPEPADLRATLAAPIQEATNHPSYLTADFLIQQVLARNPSLAQMASAAEAAQARYPQVKSLDDPMFMAGIAPASFGSRTVEPGYRLEISQKFPFPGKRTLKGEGALAEASAVSRDVDETRLRLIEEVHNALADYFLAERGRDVNTDTVQLLREFKLTAEARYRAGQVTQQDVLLGELEIMRQSERGLTVERMRRVALARINTLMHLPVDSVLPAAPPELKRNITIASLTELTNRALGGRPEVLALFDRVRADEAALALAQKEACPDIEFSAAYDSIMGNGPMRDLAPQIGIRINVPIYRARRDAMVQEARARLAQRHAELANRIDQVSLQVTEAFAQVEESAKIVALYNESLLPVASQNVQSARSAYETAKTPFANLIDAQRMQVMIRERYLEAQAELYRRQAALERAVGG